MEGTALSKSPRKPKFPPICGYLRVIKDRHVGHRWEGHQDLFTETGTRETQGQEEEPGVTGLGLGVDSDEAVGMWAPGTSTIPAMFREAMDTSWTWPRNERVDSRVTI